MVADLTQEIPVKIKDKDFTEDSLHSQFRTATLPLLLGPDAASNVAGMMKMGKDALMNKVDDFTSGLDSLGADAIDFADDLKELTTNPNIKNIGSDLLSAIPELKSKLDDVKQRTSQLQARINSKQDFSPQRVDGIIAGLNSIKSLVPSTPGLSSLFASQSSSLLGGAQSLPDSFTSIISHASRVAGFKDSLVSNILPGDIFSSNFTKLYSMYQEMSSNIDSLGSNLKSGNGGRGMEALGSTIGKVNSLIGQFKMLSNKQFSTDLKDSTNPVVQQMKGLAEGILGHNFPTTDVKKISNDIKALVKSADRLVSSGRVPNAGVIDAIKTRVSATIDSVKNNLTTFKNILNVFEPAVTVAFNAFKASIGTVAPAALDALLQGNMVQFEKTLANPNLLTMAGHAVSEMKDFVATAKNLTTPDMAKIGTLISFLAGQHKRQMQAASITNVAENRSKALKSFDYFVNTVLRPLQLMAKGLNNKYGA